LDFFTRMTPSIGASCLHRLKKGVVCAVLLILAFRALAGTVVRVRIGEGAYANLRRGCELHLECHVPLPSQTASFFSEYLANPDDWQLYKNLQVVPVPFSKLKPSVQRTMLLAVFPDDRVDQRGWIHVVQSYSPTERESLASLCEWLTGSASSAGMVARFNDRFNEMKEQDLEQGQQLIVPAVLLRPIMRELTPVREGEPTATLTYHRDAEGEYARYILGSGEALYTAVVVRFTDIRDNADILRACDVVQQRSGIANVHDMKPGQHIRIPLDMLSARYMPATSEERQAYEEVLIEAKRLKGKVTTTDLQGVVVVLDPGHGGNDHGSQSGGRHLSEDEINYDIVCRVKRLLETKTAAKVYVTMLDLSQGYKCADAKRFTEDKDEVILCSPQYPNGDATTSANLRWYLSNAIYLREKAAGLDPRKILFTSFHCDALYNRDLRGAMVYIPGARYRRDKEPRSAVRAAYLCYDEVRTRPYFTSTASERRRDEALSRNFAETLLDELGKKRIKRHSVGDPIRNVIRQDGGIAYVPAVLRNNLIPTKVLVEAANLTNSTDCERVADPEWREMFAEAYVNALKTHFGS